MDVNANGPNISSRSNSNFCDFTVYMSYYIEITKKNFVQNTI